jgi:O-antigen/teichoic acid export membrane protein
MMDTVFERKKVLLLSGGANTAFVILTGTVGFLSLPIGLQYFGPVRYGVWLVISSLTAYLGLLSCGIPTAATTLVAQARDEIQKWAVLHRSLQLALALGAVCLMFLLLATRLFADWARVLGQVPPQLRNEAATALRIFTILTLMQMPSLIFPAAFSGLQQVYWERAYGFFRSLALLGALFAAIWIKGNLVMLALFSGIGTALVGLISGIHLSLRHPKLASRSFGTGASTASTRTILGSGIRFMSLQIAVLIIWNSDNLVISHVLGPASVTPYAMTFKLFQACFLLITASVVALWPMYAQACGQGDWNWIQRTYDYSIAFQIMLGGLVWIGGILFAEPVLMYFVPGAYAGMLVAFALGGYVYVSAFFGANAGLINGLNPTTPVVAMGMLEAILNLGFSLTLIRYLGIGGVAVGTFLASTAINSWLPALYIRRRTQNRVCLVAKPFLKHSAAVVLFVVVAVVVGSHTSGILRWILGLVIVAAYGTVSFIFTLIGMAENLAAMFPGVRVLLRRAPQAL